MDGFLTGPVTVCLVVGLLLLIIGYIRRKRSDAKTGSRYPALLDHARALGGANEPGHQFRVLLPSAGGETLTVTATDFGKYGPAWIWLGAEIKQGTGDFGALVVERLPNAVVRRETDNDRTGKRLGLNLEPQTGDPTFDAEAYVETKDPDPVLAILRAPGVVAVLQEILQRTDASVVFNAGGHAVALRFSRHGLALDVAEVQWAADALCRLVAVLPAIRTVAIAPPPSRARRVLAGIGTSVGFVAVLVPTMLLLRYRAPVSPSFVPVALATAIASVVAGVTVAWSTSKQKPRGLARFVALALFSFAALPALSVSALCAANSLPDDSTEEVRVKVVGQRIQKSRRSRSYYVTVSPFGGIDQNVELRVSSSEYAAAPVGSDATLELGRGTLGYKWLRALRP